MKIAGNCNHNYMFPIKVLCLLLFATPAFAQKVFTYRSIGISQIQFQENLSLEKNISRDTDFANYRGTVIQYQKQSSVQELGFSIGVLGGLGRAVAASSGENLNFTGGAKWFLFGVTPKAYYRVTRPVSLGLQGLAFYKSISWSDYDGISAKSKHNFNFALLGDLSMQIRPDVEIVQSVGSINGDATLWKIGMNYLY